jgi:hypothetical protein
MADAESARMPLGARSDAMRWSRRIGGEAVTAVSR